MEKALWSGLLALLFVTPGVAQSAPPGLERCLTLDEATLRRELRGVSRGFFDAELGAVDLPRMVENKWLELGMAKLLETEVGHAIDGTRGETVGWRRLTATLFPAQATELAERIANRTFSSEAFRTRLETLAGEVAADFTGTFTSVTARSASSATGCIQTYLGSAYGDAVSLAFEAEVQAQLEATGMDALTGDVRPESVVGLRSGVGVATIAGGYVARAVVQRLGVQLSRRIAGNITARILGRAGSSVIPVVGWLVGGGLIAWDVINGVVRGPFPAIERQLSGEETQRQIQQEIVASLQEDLPEVSAELSAGIADELFVQWQRFTQSFAGVLELSARDAAFRQTLNGVPEINLYRLAEVVRAVPEASVLTAARTDDLRRVVELPDHALEILETSSSIPVTLAWADLAGTQLADVADFEVYRYKDPEAFSQRTLARLLDTDNAGTVARVAALPAEPMTTLLALPKASLNALADEFSTGELQTVAWYADALAKDPFDTLVVRLIESPPRLTKFEPEAVRNAVVQSRNRATAVAFLGSEPGPGLGFLAAFNRDLSTVLRGEVSGRLLSAKYDVGGFLVVGLLAAALVFAVILVLNRVSRFFRRRTRA